MVAKVLHIHDRSSSWRCAVVLETSSEKERMENGVLKGGRGYCFVSRSRVGTRKKIQFDESAYHHHTMSKETVARPLFIWSLTVLLPRAEECEASEINCARF
jgi:hypothetical protein